MCGEGWGVWECGSLGVCGGVGSVEWRCGGVDALDAQGEREECVRVVVDSAPIRLEKIMPMLFRDSITHSLSSGSRSRPRLRGTHLVS